MKFLVRIFLVVVFLAPCVVRSQSGPASSAGPRTIALGWSDVADARDMQAASPALRPDTASRLLVNLMPSPTGIPGSWTAGGNGYYAVTALDKLGASFSTYVLPDVYSEEIIGAQYSRSFIVDSLRYASGGIRLRYISQSFANYLPVNIITLDLGAAFDLLPNLTLGVAATHVEGLWTNQGVDTVNRIEYFGASFRAVPADDRQYTLTINAAVETSDGLPTVFHAGVEYEFDPNVTLRAGMETGTHTLTAGLGIHFGSTILDFAILRHPILGTSFCFGVGYAL